MNVTWLECMVVMTCAFLVIGVANGTLFSVPDSVSSTGVFRLLSRCSHCTTNGIYHEKVNRGLSLHATMARAQSHNRKPLSACLIDSCCTPQHFEVIKLIIFVHQSRVWAEASFFYAERLCKYYFHANDLIEIDLILLVYDETEWTFTP